jgi:hypothetical protein
MKIIATLVLASACYAQGIPFHQLRITPSTGSSPVVGEVDFASKNNAHIIGLAAPDTLSGDVTFRLPAADGTAGQAICTDGSKNLSFCSGGTGAAGGPNTSIQLNNSGAFDGSANLVFDSVLQKLTATGISGTAAIDSATGFIQSEGGFNSNANAWNGVESATDGADLRGYTVRQNTAGTNGGYIDFSPITYNPYGSPSQCLDQYGNIVNQPDPLPGISSFILGTATSSFSAGATSITVSAVPAGVGAFGQISGPGIPLGDYITGVSGTSISLAIPTSSAKTSITVSFFDNQLFLWNSASPEMPLSGSCGTPLPSNTLFGINTNGYLFARGGLATDIPYYNSIQSMVGGVFGRALFTSDIFNGTGVTCATPGTCGGAYYNTNGSNGVPTLLAGDSWHAGAFYFDNSTGSQMVHNGTAFKATCLVGGNTRQILIDFGVFGCTESANLIYDTSTNILTVGAASDGLFAGSGQVTVDRQVACSGGCSGWARAFRVKQSAATAQTAVFGALGSASTTLTSAFFGVADDPTTNDPTGYTSDKIIKVDGTGNVTMPTHAGASLTVTGITTSNGGYAGPVFNSTATGSTTGFQLANSKFVIDGNGNLTVSGQLDGPYLLLQKQGSSPAPGTNLGGLWTNSAGGLSYRYQTGSVFNFLDASGNLSGGNISASGQITSSSFMQATIGFDGLGTAFNAVQAPNGGMHALSLTAANYIQTGHHSGAPSLTASDASHPGWLYWDDGLGKLQVFDGTAWGDVSAGGAGSPASPNTSVQFNNAGSFGGSANLEWDNTNKWLTIASGAGTTSGFVGNVFNSTAANSALAPAFQTQSASMVIYGDGHGTFQNIVVNSLSSNTTIVAATDMFVGGTLQGLGSPVLLTGGMTDTGSGDVLSIDRVFAGTEVNISGGSSFDFSGTTGTGTLGGSTFVSSPAGQLTISAQSYKAGSAVGVSGTTCTAWTSGLCTHI